jgi:hypothetical protein
MTGKAGDDWLAGAGASRTQQTKGRPALLPASTIPGSVDPARRRDRLSQGGSGRGLAAPVGPSGSLRRSIADPVPVPAGSAPRLAAGFGSLAGIFLLGLAASNSNSLSVVREASFAVVLSRFLPPGGFRFRRTLEGKWVRLWLAPLPRASSFRLPGPSLPSASSSCELPPLSAGPSLRASIRFRKAAPCHRKDIGTDCRVSANAESRVAPVDNGDIGDNMG